MTALAAGFADAPHDSQRVFRAVLDAYAHPGRIVAVPANLEASGALGQAATAFLLTLVDRETPLWLAPDLDSDELREFARFHTGAPIVDERNAAAFAFLTPTSQPLFDGFAVGSDAYPDRSATLVIQVPALSGGPLRKFSGPGINGSTEASVAGLTDSFWRDWMANRALFPCGVDVVFAAGSQLLALPRSIAVEA
jgi:alpha-D-ribose 1-methylphosphonate 5-triphosphate synthase subunit PhnH